VAIVAPILVLVLGLNLLGYNISTGAECGGIDVFDTFMQAIAVTLVTYVTYITRRLDKEVYRGGE
jgi:hypothetical protein